MKKMKLFIVALVALTSLAMASGASAASASVHARPTARGCPQWASVADAAGWDAASYARLSKIMWRESRCQPTAINHRSHDYGLVQIHCAGRANWCARIGLTPEQMLDPYTNLSAALYILKHQGWAAWR